MIVLLVIVAVLVLLLSFAGGDTESIIEAIEE